MRYQIETLGDEAVIIRFFGASDSVVQKRILAFTNAINHDRFAGYMEAVMAYQTVTLYFTPQFNQGCSPFDFVQKHIERILQKSADITIIESKTLNIPVCYDIQVGSDLPVLANELKLSIEEIIQLHSEPLYEVRFIGFSPGFPFLTGMDERLAFPRKSTPQLKIPPGSVGIAGLQTGIYSLETPGGWNIIGRTPITLFDKKKSSPAFFKQGDRVKLVPISYSDFIDWKESSWPFE